MFITYIGKISPNKSGKYFSLIIDRIGSFRKTCQTVSAAVLYENKSVFTSVFAVRYGKSSFSVLSLFSEFPPHEKLNKLITIKQTAPAILSVFLISSPFARHRLLIKIENRAQNVHRVKTMNKIIRVVDVVRPDFVILLLFEHRFHRVIHIHKANVNPLFALRVLG